MVKFGIVDYKVNFGIVDSWLEFQISKTDTSWNSCLFLLGIFH